LFVDIENAINELRKGKPGYQSLIALPLKKSGKVIGNFNFTPVRKTFDAEEVELLEKRLKMSLCFEVLKKKFKIKKRKKLFFKVRKDTILLRRYLREYFAWMFDPPC
jgi:hypothetical protein